MIFILDQLNGAKQDQLTITISNFEKQQIAKDEETAIFLASNAINNNNTGIEQQDVSLNILLTVIYLFILVIGLVGNFCYCYVVAVDTRHRLKSATNYYLFSLSISDILLLLFGLPHDVANLWSPRRYLFGEFGCVARGWISEASTNASVLVIVAFTVERYFAICHPMRSSMIKADSLSRSVKIILAIWLIASSFALLVVKQYGIASVPQMTASLTNDSPTAPLPQQSSQTTTDRTTPAQIQLQPQLQLHHQNTQQQQFELNASSTKTMSIECTIVQLSKATFELSSLIFFVLPMTIITILYGKIVYKLRKRNNQLNIRNSSSAQTPLHPTTASSGPLYTTTRFSFRQQKPPASSCCEQQQEKTTTDNLLIANQQEQELHQQHDQQTNSKSINFASDKLMTRSCLPKKIQIQTYHEPPQVKKQQLTQVKVQVEHQAEHQDNFLPMKNYAEISSKCGEVVSLFVDSSASSETTNISHANNAIAQYNNNNNNSNISSTSAKPQKSNLSPKQINDDISCTEFQTEATNTTITAIQSLNQSFSCAQLSSSACCGPMQPIALNSSGSTANVKSVIKMLGKFKFFQSLC